METARNPFGASSPPPSPILLINDDTDAFDWLFPRVRFLDFFFVLDREGFFLVMK